MATAAVTKQLAFAYKSAKGSDPLLLRAAHLAASLDQELAVCVPFVIPADGPGCCGLRGQRWRDMLREVAEEDAQRARQLLAETEVGHSVTVAEGSSVLEILEEFVTAGNRHLALPDTAAGTALSRSDLRRIRRRCPVPVEPLSAMPAPPS